MKTGQLGTLSMAVIAAALAGCASQEVKPETAPAPSASVAPAPRGAGAAASSAPRAAVAARLAPRSAAAAPDKRTVYYDFDQYDIKPEFRSIIEANAKYLSGTSNAITIEGNCDERGSREYNLALGQRRADSVKSLMKLLGVPEARMETVSYGEEKPADAGHGEAAWAQNRRSQIVYKK